jgi:hypothetical protein
LYVEVKYRMLEKEYNYYLTTKKNCRLDPFGSCIIPSSSYIDASGSGVDPFGSDITPPGSDVEPF